MAFDMMRKDYEQRKAVAKPLTAGKFVKKEDAVRLLETVIRPGDRVCLEGDNQKQADFLAKALVSVDPAKVNRLHMVQSSIVLPEHIQVFEKGIATDLDFAFSGPQMKELYELVVSRKAKIGAIHTYLEIYGRYFLDLYPQVSLIVAEEADQAGNLFTGFTTEDTPIIAEATHFRSGIVIAQVKKKVASVPRVDIPGDWVDYVIETGEDFWMQALFTRDPAKITDQQVLMAMMTIKGIYSEYNVGSLNHGLGFPTAAVELLLPTYGKELGIEGRACYDWVLNPHPTMIPAIEAGIARRVYAFGGEPGMEEYVKARPDVFCIGPDGNMRSNRCAAHMAGLYAIDAFVGATLQVDRFGNSSTAIKGRISGFGGAPNLGGTPPGRRHVTEAFTKAGYQENGVHYGRKLVVQLTPTKSEGKGIPVFVPELYAQTLYKEGLFPAPPIMIAGDQLTHVVTEVGIAYIDKARDLKTRMQAIAAVAGETEVGAMVSDKERSDLRSRGIVKTPEDLEIDRGRATRELLAAKSLQDLIDISGGLYKVPASISQG
ncbi:MAG TPA: malonate decarboxylase subunit alpha [Spirochaetota bacterium]|nr:malonate decarboxylase subunit alpha [Spirochaetota bacterium]